MNDTATLYKLLRARYEQNGRGRGAEWITIREAPDGSAYGGRSCDLVAIGVWAKTKSQIIGHEVKSSRSDWLKELNDPAKSEAFLSYFNKFYIVASYGIVKVEEVRGSWGLMELAKNGKSLKIRKQADLFTPKPLTTRMQATWFRRIASSVEDVAARRLKEHVESSDKELEDLAAVTRELHTAKRDYNDLKEQVETFELASGVKIPERWYGDDVGAAVRALRSSSPEDIKSEIKKMRDRLQRMLDASEETIEALDSLDA